MSAGSGSKGFRDAYELERFLIEAFGEDFRNKVLVGPLSVFRLADTFEECGLKDPKAPPESSEAYGIMQWAPIPREIVHVADPVANARAAMRYVAERYGG